MNSYKEIPSLITPSLKVSKDVVTKKEEKVYNISEKVYKEYCPACNEYIIPKGDRCPNSYCRWSLR